MIFGRLSRKPTPPTEVLTHSAVKAIVQPAFDVALAPLGLVRQKTMAWCDPEPTSDGLRRIFELHWKKGGKLAPAWGYALGFVPHVAADRVAWHRTFKSARADYLVEASGMDMDMLHGEAGLRGPLPGIVKRAVAAARTYWFEAPGLDDLPAVHARTLADREANRNWPIDMYVPLRLAWAFSLARLGRTAEARTELEMWLLDFPQEDTVARRLCELLADAAEDARAPKA